ncbi:uncharacterized protein SPSK_02093 [Sporothrix schenckii 1099-18]|uniref:Cytochrome b5 heme-binding domain-containing protein n=1 Tax=Sporothrix schenckii 1099-18 TaxID=1397361 RepID=A0A0F2MH25_SPOSC|nr:uncharacterized protein SPSK_02093 [Sporothrix schenckii 1099-18]KJR87456.1 hypothetical protein SPSK_02093 [Sporothrix schenckii 1099-18]
MATSTTVPKPSPSPSSIQTTTTPVVADRDRILQPDEVTDRIAQGQTIVIYQDYVLRLDSWLDRHPGGRLAILHMVGKDATDEIEV